jgi:assimilatory nitrate reductase catalytic subunit
MPNATAIADALRQCPFVVVSDLTIKTDTAQFADIFLPAAGWGEKDGTVTNSERRISRQRAFLQKPGAALPDWKIICDVAIAMGFEGFTYTTPAEIFAEHAALTQKLNNGSRKLDLTAWQSQDYDTLEPQQWGGVNPFDDLRFQTPDGKARFVRTAVQTPTKRTFTLNTGRARDQWHTMTRTGLSPRLFRHRAEPYVEISPVDATRLGIAPANLVEISANGNRSIARALVTKAVKTGDIFQPMHWSGSFAKTSSINVCTESKVDPISGQPALKSAGVSISLLKAAWYGFGISLSEIHLASEYYAVRPIVKGMAFECAGTAVPEDWGLLLYEALGGGGNISSLQSHDVASFRCAVMRDGKLTFAFFASRNPIEVSRNWLEGQIGSGVNPLDVLAGRAHLGVEDQGAILCACMNVGVGKITAFLKKVPSSNLEQVCKATSAGTGCGSCRVEIRSLLNAPLNVATDSLNAA